MKPPIIEFRKNEINIRLGQISIAISMPPAKFNNKDNGMNDKARWRGPPFKAFTHG